MSSTTLTLPHMDKPPSKYDVTVRVGKDDGHQPDPATFAIAASTAASRRNASVVSAHTRPRKSSASSAWPRQAARRGSRRLGRRGRRAQGRRSGPLTQPVRVRCPLSCGGSKNSVCRSWSWQRLHSTRMCPMPRPRPTASWARRADARRPAHLCPAGPQMTNGQHCGLFSIEKRASKRSCPDQPLDVNDHRGRIRTRSRRCRPGAGIRT